ncbi:MAG: DUF192 domain-containing protein [Pseudomonadota bacterium]
MRSSAGLLALLLVVPAAQAGERLPLVVGSQTIQVEVAATPQARQRGLMGRTHLPSDSGMLFVFEAPGRHCFWMRDTPLPLSIAFIDASGRVAGFTDMQPRTDTLHCPPTAVRYALEIAQGSFLRPLLAPGTRVQGLPR